MNTLFALIAAITMNTATPSTYSEKVENVVISIEYQKNQGLSGDIERTEVTTAKMVEKTLEGVHRFSSLPVGVTLVNATKKTTVYDFKDNKGKRSKDSEVSETTCGRGYGLFVGDAVFANGATLIATVKDEHGMIDETYKCGKFATQITPYIYFATPIRIGIKVATGTLKYAYVNAEDTYIQKGAVSFVAAYQRVELGGISHSACVITIEDSGAIIQDVVLDTCDDATFSAEINKFTNGNYTPRQTWRGSASDIMTTITSTVSVHCNEIIAR